MKRNYIPVSEYLKETEKYIKKVASSVTLTLFLMSNTVQATAPNNYSSEMGAKIEDARAISLPERNGTDVTFGDPQVTISLNENLYANCSDMMNKAVLRIGFDDKASIQNKHLIEIMTECLSSIPATKVTADFDTTDQSLEFVFLLKGGLIVSVSKPVATVDNDTALLTFVYKRNVVWVGNVPLSDVAQHIQSIDSKL